MLSSVKDLAVSINVFVSLALFLDLTKNIRNQDHRIDQLDLTLVEIESAKILWQEKYSFTSRNPGK